MWDMNMELLTQIQIFLIALSVLKRAKEKSLTRREKSFVIKMKERKKLNIAKMVSQKHNKCVHIGIKR